ncbi:SRPBCC domain-containing protein [Nocardia tengchongensis]|uniref:SRPBCC family protein n=1 Tax=Nocardia tengchongensis TaxID=2055889 RepID=UPI003699FC5C
MAGTSFTTEFAVSQSPRTVFDAVLDVRGWWSASLAGKSATVGDVFFYEVPGIHRLTIEVIEAEPARTVVWRVRDSWLELVEDKAEWTDTIIRFEIDEVDGETTLRFTHEGLVPEFECFDVCRKGWDFYVGTSLRKLITTGEGEPAQNQSASVVSAQGATIE